MVAEGEQCSMERTDGTVMAAGKQHGARRETGLQQLQWQRENSIAWRGDGQDCSSSGGKTVAWKEEGQDCGSSGGKTVRHKKRCGNEAAGKQNIVREGRECGGYSSNSGGETK